MNLKKLLIVLTLLGINSVVFGQKIPQAVTIDIDRALAGYHKAQGSEALLLKDVERLNKVLAERTAALKSQDQELDVLEKRLAEEPLPADERSQLELTVREKRQAFEQSKVRLRQFHEEKSGELRVRRSNMMEFCAAEIRDAVQVICEKRGADLALSAGQLTFLLEDNVFDATDDVVKMLNAQYAVEGK